MTEEAELSQLLTEGGRPSSPDPDRLMNQAIEKAPPEPHTPVRTDFDFSQWQVLPNGKYRPGVRSTGKIPAGAYRVEEDQLGPFLETVNILSDDIVELPEESHLRVLSGIRKFWQSRKRYQRHGLLYKRGILLWGPPGGGKTVTSQLLVREIVAQHDGIVIIAENPRLTVDALRFLRRIEPSRPLIVLLEDLDEIVARHHEHQILAILDGEHQTDNVVYVATTNYPERLGARIINRPSRFDERIKIGMPSPAARLVYLRKACHGADLDLGQWCADTEGLSIAHLRELVVAVVCLEQPYESVIERLRAMEIRPRDEEGFRRKSIGLVDSSAKCGAGTRN